MLTRMSRDLKRSKTLAFVFLATATPLFVYVTLRAYMLGFTHDESLTFTILIGETGWILTANNHWLNTILAYVSSQLFGLSELALRLPNVLSFLAYSYFCYKLAVKESTQILPAILSIIFLMLNPYVIDFFGLARGYGLSMAFLAGSLFYFLESANNPDDTTTLGKGLILSTLAIYSNFAFVIPIIALHLGYLFQTFAKGSKRLFCKERLLFFGIEAVALIPVFGTILILKMSNQLYFGGTKNIIEDTLFSIFTKTFQVELFSNQNLIILLLVLSALLCGFMIKKHGSLKFLLVALSAVFVLPVVLHFTLGIKYPLGRAALYWILFLGVYLYVFLEALFETKRRVPSCLFTIIISCLSFFVAISFFCTMNLRYAQEWKYDADTHSMIEVLSKRAESKKEHGLVISWIFEPTVNYYRWTKNYTWLQPVTWERMADKEYDYYYVLDGRRVTIGCQKEVKSFGVSNTKLIKNCR